MGVHENSTYLANLFLVVLFASNLRIFDIFAGSGIVVDEETVVLDQRGVAYARMLVSCFPRCSYI